MKRYMSLLETSAEGLETQKRKAAERTETISRTVIQTLQNIIKETEKIDKASVIYTGAVTAKQGLHFNNEDYVIDEEDVLNWIKEES